MSSMARSYLLLAQVFSEQESKIRYNVTSLGAQLLSFFFSTNHLQIGITNNDNNDNTETITSPTPFYITKQKTNESSLENLE